jgi:hypothetical protein
MGAKDSSFGLGSFELARIHVVATDGRSTDGLASLCGAGHVLAPACEQEGHSPRIDASVVLGCFVVKPVDQWGAHVGGDIDMPRGTQRRAW